MKKIFSACLMCLLAWGCATYNSADVISSGERYAPNADDRPYLIGPGDQLGITVYNETGITGTYAVGADGTVTLPLVGVVKAEGKTPQELAKDTQDLYAAGYLRLPSVSVQVTQYRPIYVLGEVNTAGQYPYAPGMSALSAIATAKGFSPRAEKKVLFIRREGSDIEQVYALTAGLRIYPGDTIRVEERYF
ncbi:polysaccharide biosynthesis/export family protein [Novosphingobium album (ex Liu et al. 2023)]|uniref:Polysaccharide export protein n=1 Tax=Novosphingobium album (ex Liu et al. 2023) TaxID=3031130 RepID=A0ABT5WQK5_9SPHN|nr:polysaccharide biosynthesis/export family protein [Novosphingobium album (ex Liu et al. 2023)]MDE8652291.1 polysaccharide export protein [Novosphingobium album (ex Liu et al. 2023)]